MQEGALTALASVADAANAHFIRYYDTVMPMLKSVLYNAHNKAEQLLRAKALECVSLVGMAVGKERFRADAQEVMAFMQQLQVSICVCLSVCLPVCLPLCLSVSLFVCLSFCLLALSLCVCPSFCPSVHISVCLCLVHCGAASRNCTSRSSTAACLQVQR